MLTFKTILISGEPNKVQPAALQAGVQQPRGHQTTERLRHRHVAAPVRRGMAPSRDNTTPVVASLIQVQTQ